MESSFCEDAGERFVGQERSARAYISTLLVAIITRSQFELHAGLKLYLPSRAGLHADLFTAFTLRIAAPLIEDTMTAIGSVSEACTSIVVGDRFLGVFEQ